MSARDVMVIILSIVSILFFAVLSFAICRRCSAYYDEAICKWYIKIPRTFCATLISFDQHVNAKLQPVWVSQYNRQKMSLIGFVAYILIFFRIIQFANITLHLFGCQFMGWEWEHPESIKPMFSNLLQTIAVFTCLDMVNNWRLWRN